MVKNLALSWKYFKNLTEFVGPLANRKLDFPELDVQLLLRAIGVYPRVPEQEEQPGLISASRRRPRLNCR
jgi:hypothetical protein